MADAQAAGCGSVSPRGLAASRWHPPVLLNRRLFGWLGPPPCPMLAKTGLHRLLAVWVPGRLVTLTVGALSHRQRRQHDAWSRRLREG